MQPTARPVPPHTKPPDHAPTNPTPRLPAARPAVPWFWISGVFMFLGCFLLNAAAHERKDELLPVLGLVAAFNLYEFAVLGLAYWLQQRGATTQAWQLVWLAAILLADTTLVYNTVAVVGPVIGATTALIGLALAALKLVVILRITLLRLTGQQWVATGAALTTVFLMPVATRTFGSTGFLPAGYAHAAAWWVAAVVALSAWALDDAIQIKPTQTAGQPTDRPTERPTDRLRLGILALPMISVAVHAVALLAMYRVPHLSLAELAPLLLAVSLIALRQSSPASFRRGAGVASGATAVLIAEASRQAWGPNGWPAYLSFTPVRLVLIVGTIGYATLWWRQRTAGLLLAWPTCLTIALLGHDLDAGLHRLAEIYDGLAPAARKILPRTLAQWGTAAVAAAFAVLAIGACSAKRKIPPNDPQHQSPSG